MNGTWKSAFKLGHVFVLSAVTAIGCGGPEKAIEEKLEANVLFYSNFEKGVDALWAEGDRGARLDGANTRHHLNGGVADGYVEFEPTATAMSYPAKTNFAYSDNGWSGAVAFWLSVNVAGLEADFPEPFHIGKREGNAYPWDDAVIFVDFTKPPRSLRFGCYPNKTGEISDAMVEKHVITVPNIGWKADEWHHVVITWENFNSGKMDAEWRLYIDGEEKGKKSNILMDMSWTINDIVARFNHYKYSGKIDEIAVFGTSLSLEDAKYLYKPIQPLNVILKKGP
tara:strand:- start:1523 stop:2368 length:846 start_codon:yes stop_codon:yes gene_type:complete